MATSTVNTNKPIIPRGVDDRPVDKYNRAELYSGKALDFDGVNDQITLGTISDLTFGTGDFSVVLDWQIDSVSTYSWAIAKNPVTDLGIGINNTGGLLRLWIGGTLSLGTENILGSDWKKIAVVRESGVVSAYINGVAISLTETAMAGSIDSGELFVGSWVSNADFWNGLLNNIRIFNTALTAAQVAELYNNPEKIVPTGVDNTALKLWLPMQEGAGTTAYDGSGNGNHGTISGATYTHGIGAPVSQTAVISWNKGTNKIVDSELYTTSVSFRGMTKNSTTEESPIGTFDAVKMTENNTNVNPALVLSTTNNNSSAHTAKVYLKADTATSIAFATNGSSNPGNINVTTEWQSFEVTQSINVVLSVHIGGFSTITQGGGIVLYVWHPQLQEASSAGPYVGTIGTSQPSPVLLPQGLTSGRDITGVNLFENVRKQGALNLDGNSWAEVHDNASLDVTTGLTLESWIYIEDNATQGRILNKWGGSSADRSYQMFMNNALIRFLIGDGTSQNGLNSATSLSVGNWYHIVCTYDSTNIKIYIDGSEDVSVAETFTLVDSAETLYIGTYYNQTNTSVNPLAQPRIYNRALTASEVLNNYNATSSLYI